MGLPGLSMVLALSVGDMELDGASGEDGIRGTGEFNEDAEALIVASLLLRSSKGALSRLDIR